MTKRSYGDGGIDQRGENSFRLRYRIGKRRFAVTFHGTLAEARTELRRLLRSGDTGEHVAPDKGTLAEWAKKWLEAGAPGQKNERQAHVPSNVTISFYGLMCCRHSGNTNCRKYTRPTSTSSIWASMARFPPGLRGTSTAFSMPV